MSSGVRARSQNDWLIATLVGLTMLGIAWGTVHMPWVITGAVLGTAVLALALTAPIAMVVVMLAIGPIDLSFLTGGFKALFPEMGGLDMNGIRLIAATAGFLAYILFEPRSKAAAVGALGRLWLVFLTFALATLFYSMDPLGGLRLIMKLAYPLLTFLIVVGAANSRERVQALMNYVLISVALLVLVLNPILVLRGGYRVDDGITRLGGLGIGDNPFSFYAMAMCFIVFTRFVLRGQLRYLFFAGVLLLWVALTQTRIAAGGSIVGLSIIGLLSAMTSGNRKILIAAVAMAAIAGVIMIPHVLVRSFGFVPTPAEFLKLAANPVALYESINWQGRQLLWAILWGAFMTSPLIGLGMGSSGAVIETTFPDQNVKVAHNEYMRMATDGGLIGVALFAIAVFSWLIPSIRFALRGDKHTREFAFPAVACIMAWSIISITDNAFDYYTPFTQYIGFLVAGAVVTSAAARDEAVAVQNGVV